MKYGNKTLFNSVLRKTGIKTGPVYLLLLTALCIVFKISPLVAAEIVCPDVADLYIDEWNPDDNFNYKARILVATNKNIHHGISRGLLRFDVPVDIEISDIKSAAIYLSSCTDCGGGNGGEIGFYALNKPFDETTDTWNSLAGGDWDTSVYSQATLPKGNDWNQAVNGEPPPNAKGFDITSLLRQNLNKVRDNGIMMRFVDEHQEPYTHQNIASRETTEPLDFPPRIVIQTNEPLCPATVLFHQEPKTLSLLRKFRDQILLKTPEGKKYIELYYCHASEISLLLITDQNLRLQTESVLKGNLVMLENMINGCLLSNFKDIDNSVKILIEAFKLKASPQLRDDLTQLQDSLFEINIQSIPSYPFN